MRFFLTYLLIQDKILEVQKFLVGTYDMEINNTLKNENAHNLPKLMSICSVRCHDFNDT